MISILLVSLALLQQPGATPPAQQPTAFDSTRHVIVQVGEGVADVKTGLDLLRRAVFNSPPGDVVVSGYYLRRACRTLDLEARLAERRVCRRCAAAPLQQALDGYRAVMPTLARTGARCAARMTQLSRGPDTSAARALRDNIRVIGDDIIAGIMPYEQRLAVVRVRAGWAESPVETPRTPPR